MSGCRSCKANFASDAYPKTTMHSYTANPQESREAGAHERNSLLVEKIYAIACTRTVPRQQQFSNTNVQAAAPNEKVSVWLRWLQTILGLPRVSSLVRGIFHTNGVKCHVNKLCAEQWARQRGQVIYYAVATDKVSARALHEKPDIAHDKLTWLQRSDADCGNRYGVLPLCMGMPVQAREHLYRKEFKILKGCHGTVCRWARVETETASADGAVIWNKLPEYIFVRFETRTRWTIPGIDEENVFPVSVQSGLWFLDAGRANPQLKVTRYQFPIAPDFADTFYGAQGSTIEPGVIVDMIGADPIAAYIGMTRCRTRQKILIYRPFPLAPFQEGLPLGRQLLLDVWKQEPVDWDALRKKYLDERPCHECGEMKRKDAFTKAQWKQDTYRVCKECSARKREAGTPYRCTQCGLWHAAAHFASKHQNPRWSMYRVCLSCDAVKHCFACKRKQTKEYFGTAAWTARKPNRRVCLQCQTRTQGFWTCAACHQRRPQLQFSYNFRPSLSSGLREKMELRYVTLVTQKLRRKFSASEQRQPPLHGWSRCVKEFAVLRFCERHGKQLPKSEMHNNCSQSNFLQRRIQ